MAPTTPQPIMRQSRETGKRGFDSGLLGLVPFPHESFAGHPVVHGTTYEALREVSPLLASQNGLNTQENSMDAVAAKLAELIAFRLRR